MLENLIVAQLSRNLPFCVIPCSEEPGTGFCIEPVELIPHPYHVSKIRFNNILSGDTSLNVSGIKA